MKNTGNLAGVLVYVGDNAVGLPSMAKKRKRSFFGIEMLVQAAKRVGAKIVMEPEWGEVIQITFPNGVRRYARSATLDINALGAVSTARDKGYARFFMKRMGYPVPKGQTFFREDFRLAIGATRDIEAACAYAQSIGYPVMVKPNSGCMGEGVFMAHNESHVRRALRHVFTLDRIALIEKFITGVDVRILVLDGEVMAAYQRIPLTVVGDGKSSLEQLIVRHLRALARQGRSVELTHTDPRIASGLKRHGYTVHSVPQRGEQVVVLANANLSTGGSLLDVTTTLAPTIKEAAIRLTHDMGLRFCGVDMMIQGDITSPTVKWYVLEVNASPSIKHYACHGPEQRARVEKIYRTLIAKMGQGEP